MIKFWLKDYGEFNVFESGVSEGKAILISYRDSIRKDLSSVKENYFYLGLHLLSLYNSNVYAYDYAHRSAAPNRYVDSFIQVNGRQFCAAHSRFFFDYCEKEFGLDKSEVSRFINVVDEFHNEYMSGFKYPYSEFGFSALCELLPLTEDQRVCVSKDWTIKQIREYKRGLFNPNKVVATSQQVKPTVQSVATSQQKNEPEDLSLVFRCYAVKIPLSGDSSDYSKYDRFRGMSLQAICDKYLELENKYNDLISLSSTDSADDEECDLNEFTAEDIFGRDPSWAKF